MTERSHPPALLRRTARTLREETPLRRGDGVVVAISGGGDSTALLHVLARLAQSLSIQLWAHGVDHGLRAEAASELDLAEGLATRLGVPFSRSRLSLAAGGNLQARAREARYAALNAVRERVGARWIATGHHADDRAETLLMRILRGTGPRGLAVLPAASEPRLRPFIRSPKSAIAAHLERHRLAFANDPSNHHPRFVRSRVRDEVMPLLESLVPGASARLNLLADEWTDPAASFETAPFVTDAQGHPLPLRRSHAAQIRRAQKLGQRGARVWLGGGVEIIPCGNEAARTDVVGSRARTSKKPRSAKESTAGRGAKTTKSD